MSLADRPWLQTYTGGAWCADDPADYQYSIPEIAHALSNTCRFAGHCREFYSVSQHSVLVAQAVAISHPGSDKRLLQAALLHDAAEAFCLDMPSPIKRTPMMDAYRVWIRKVETEIGWQFRLLEYPTNPAIKYADLQVLATEKRDVLGSCIHDAMWLETVLGGLPAPLESVIKPLPPKRAKALFIKHWESLR